jgi:hypothetical protein
MKGSNDTWLGGRIAMSIPTWYQHASTLRWAQVKAACRSALGLSILVVLSLFVTQHALAAKCLYISSYHRGYAWSDGVEKGVRSVLDGRCEIQQFDRDANRKCDIWMNLPLLEAAGIHIPKQLLQKAKRVH